MLKYRTVSHLLKIFILPEIEKRIEKGTIKDCDLPVELYQFRAIQKKKSLWFNYRGKKNDITNSSYHYWSSPLIP